MSFQLKDLYVEVTNKCSQLCTHCSSCSSISNFSEIKLEDLKSLIDDALELGLATFTISGGEPFLYSNLLPLLEYLYRNSITSSIYSCGVDCVNGEKKTISESRFLSVKELGVKKIIFSLHGGCPETQEKISGLSESFILLKKSLENAKKIGLDIELHTVPMTINYNELEDIIAFAFNNSIKRVSFLRLVPQGRASESLLISKQQMSMLIDKIKLWEEKYAPVSIRLGTPLNCVTFDGKQCTAGLNKLLISATGEYFPCEAFKHLRGTRPTIYDTNVRKLWENDELLNKLRTVTMNDISICSTCKDRESCRGGCAGQRMQFNGDVMRGPDPCCQNY